MGRVWERIPRRLKPIGEAENLLRRRVVGQELKSPQLEKRLETGSIVAASPKTI